MTFNIYQPHIITKMTQGFNKDVKQIMAFSAPDKSHKGIVYNQETDKKYI